MARSSISGADRARTQAPGRDVEALGPSDSSDSGSDVAGEMDIPPPDDLDNTTFGIEQPGLDSAGDKAGTGERGAARLDEEADEAADIMPDDVRSLDDEADDAAGIAPEAELELGELTDAGDLPAIDEDRDLDEDDEG
jgi:hypothetical protein